MIQRLHGGTLTIQKDAGIYRYFWVESIWNVINLIKVVGLNSKIKKGEWYIKWESLRVVCQV